MALVAVDARRTDAHRLRSGGADEFTVALRKLQISPTHQRNLGERPDLLFGLAPIANWRCVGNVAVQPFKADSVHALAVRMVRHRLNSAPDYDRGAPLGLATEGENTPIMFLVKRNIRP